MSYIEREAAVKFFLDIAAAGRTSYNIMLLAVERTIAAIPAADARPVVRGHWITEEEEEAKGNYLLRDACSVCGHCDWDNTESKYFNFCPNCGADMRPTSMSGANGEES